MRGPFRGHASMNSWELLQTHESGEKARQHLNRRGSSYLRGPPPHPCACWVKRMGFWKSWDALFNAPVSGEASFMMRE